MNHTTTKRLSAWLLVTAAYLFAATAANAGPFGLEMGMTLQQIGGHPQQLAPGRYKLSEVPKPHSAFESYIVQVGPTSGLCWIKGVGKTISTSVFGVELHAAFDSLKARVQETYGTSKVTDAVLPGSIWSEPRYWMMGLVKKDRILVAIWERKSGATLPPEIKTIAAGARAIDSERGWVSLEYSFANETECDHDVAKAEDSAL